ncbi:MAG: urocanate hydratase, partial [Bacteroidetes bacterium]|nr:urocanate hydratase [Bacteroidota bacterium]
MSLANTVSFKAEIQEGIPSKLPPHPGKRSEKVAHAPVRRIENVLSIDEKKLAIRNALRYFPSDWHAKLAVEFAEELNTYGRIYMYRFRPQYKMHARSVDSYPHNSKQAASIMLMIQN